MLKWKLWIQECGTISVGFTVKWEALDMLTQIATFVWGSWEIWNQFLPAQPWETCIFHNIFLGPQCPFLTRYWKYCNFTECLHYVLTVPSEVLNCGSRVSVSVHFQVFHGPRWSILCLIFSEVPVGHLSGHYPLDYIRSQEVPCVALRYYRSVKIHYLKIHFFRNSL